MRGDVEKELAKRRGGVFDGPDGPEPLRAVAVLGAVGAADLQPGAKKDDLDGMMRGVPVMRPAVPISCRGMKLRST